MSVDFEEIDRLMGEDPDDRAIREAHGFTYEDDWQDESLLCRNGCGLSYPDISSRKIRECSAAGNGYVTMTPEAFDQFTRKHGVRWEQL